MAGKIVSIREYEEHRQEILLKKAEETKRLIQETLDELEAVLEMLEEENDEYDE